MTVKNVEGGVVGMGDGGCSGGSTGCLVPVKGIVLFVFCQARAAQSNLFTPLDRALGLRMGTQVIKFCFRCKHAHIRQI